MELKNVKVLGNGRGMVVNLKRKRATKQHALNFTSTSNRVDEPSDRQKKRARPCLCKNGCNCCFGKSMVKNYSNFMKSGLPKRVLYYENEAWKDISNEVIDLLREDFKTKKVISEVLCRGYRSLFDFLHMVCINLETGFQQPLAWIDESGSCFFPEIWPYLCELHGRLCSDEGNISPCRNLEPKGTHEIKMELDIAINLHKCDDKVISHVKEDAEVSVSHVRQLEIEGKPCNNCNDLDLEYVDCSKPCRKINEHSGENGCFAIPAIKYHCVASPHSELIKLANDENENNVVQRMFLVGLTPLIDGNNIVGIYRVPQGDIFEKRWQLFKKQVELTEKYRGNANVCYAWFGSTKETAARVMLHGFGHSELPKSKPMYGIGIHLSPASCSNISASYSDVDENGVQYMVLCRVIMGNIELVHPDSEQFQSSSEDFDSGIDHLQNPKHYVIWAMNMNKHIYPEYVVAFNIPPRAKDELLMNKSQFYLSGVVSLSSSQREPQQDADPADVTGSN